jgi:EAL and modified HD-GYP domain-containing signal transduction protein
MGSWFRKIFSTGGTTPSDRANRDAGPVTKDGPATQDEQGEPESLAASLQRRPLLHRGGHLAGFEVSAVTATSEPAEVASPAAGLLQGMADTAVRRPGNRAVWSLRDHANSPLLGLRRQVDSVEQALQLLGRQALFRLLTVLLVARSDSRPTAIALHELALTRAHFLENMAKQIWAPAATLYTTGLLSLLDVMMQQPMEKVLEPIGLTQESRDALLHRSGPWHELLELARCLETGQTEQARELAQPMGGLPVAQAAMERARHSAAAMAAELHDVWHGN